MYITGYTPYGDRGILIRVETDLRRGIPGIDISGLADGAVKESRERVRAAFRTSGLAFPLDRVLINLAPAGVKKEGASLDLPIALSVMSAAGLVPGLADLPEQLMVLGELELSGRVRPVRGVLAAVAAGIRDGIRFFIVPKANEEEAALVIKRQSGSVFYTAVSSLDEAVHALILLAKEGSFPPAFNMNTSASGSVDAAATSDSANCGDFAEVSGQVRYKRALEISAAGGHNLLVFGAPGSGKTMLARRLPSIMADLSSEEAVEVMRIHSLAGKFELKDENAGSSFSACGTSFSVITRPPFRSPHHSASAEGILGGGRTVQPGEVSLAHYGILFLDEAPEFKSNVLNALREPLEDRLLTIARAEEKIKLPADFMLVMAANACPCGKLGKGGVRQEDNFLPAGDCLCSPEEIHRYWRKLGGALLDRIDLRVPVNGNCEALTTADKLRENESSAAIKRRVTQAVEIQRRRFKSASNIRRNSCMPPAQISLFCQLNPAAEKALAIAVEKLSFSGRAYHSILKTARTIADLEGNEVIETSHILEAIQHRRTGDDPYDVLIAV